MTSCRGSGVLDHSYRSADVVKVTPVFAFQTSMLRLEL